MKLDQLLLGQIPEAIYFALFIIFTKQLKEKRILFTFLMVLEYIFLKHFLTYTIWFQVLYFVLAYIIIKILYKDEGHVTDIFTLGIASITIIFIGVFSYFVSLGNMLIGNLINKALLFLLLILLRHKLPKINNLYKKLWNRSKYKYKIKSTTFRAVNVFVFNISFFIINLGIIIANFIE